MINHRHTGTDALRVRQSDLKGRNERHYYHVQDGSSSTQYGVVLIAPERCYISRIKEVHGTASTSGEFDVERLADGVGQGNGTSVLGALISGTATANTVQDATLSTDVSDKRLEPDERIAITPSGTLTNQADVVFMIEITF